MKDFAIFEILEIVDVDLIVYVAKCKIKTSLWPTVITYLTDYMVKTANYHCSNLILMSLITLPSIFA